MKIFKVILIITASFIVFCFITLYFYPRVYLNAEGGFARDEPFINTHFINGNSFTDFHKVWYGMDIQEVHRHIGIPKEYYTEPISLGDREDFTIMACYSENANNDFYNYNWCRISLYYDSSLKLMDIRYNWLDGD